MAINKRCVILAALFVLALSPFIYAQDSGYYLDTDSGEPRFIQRFSWTGDEYASRYEVIILRDEEGQYRDYLRQFSAEPFIEVSLSAGKYRFHVIPHDFLDRPHEVGSHWIDIEVRAALNPVLDQSSTGLVYMQDDRSYELNLSGRDIAPDAEIFLRNSNGEKITPSVTEVQAGGSNVWLSFDESEVVPGEYELVIRNPGGLETSMSGIIAVLPPQPEPIEEPVIIADDSPAGNRWDGFYIGAAWAPLFPVYGVNEMSLLSASLRLGLINTDLVFLGLGPELVLSWRALDIGSRSAAQTISVGINLLVQKQLPGEKAALTFRLGAGYDLFTLHANLGVSFLWRLSDRFYLEAGLDHIHCFTEIPVGYAQPWFGLGFRF